MLNFTEEIKNEITSQGLETVNHKIAAFSAFVRTSGSVVSKNGFFGFELVTENDHTAEFIENILSHDFNINADWRVKSDVLSGNDKFVLSCADEKTEKLLITAGIVGEDGDGKYLNFGIAENFNDESEKYAFIIGAFLGGGSCTIPDEQAHSSTGYHLEFVFSGVVAARDFCDILSSCEIFAKLVMRKDNAVVYVKSKELVSDILYILSADGCREKLNKLADRKDMENNANRANNCSVSNLDKSLTASANQVMAIETINQTVGLKSLDEPLFEVAEARLVDKNASMQELADRLGISKSCINHRMRKIISIARELDD